MFLLDFHRHCGHLLQHIVGYSLLHFDLAGGTPLFHLDVSDFEVERTVVDMLVPQLHDDPVGAGLWQEEAQAELAEVLGEAALGRMVEESCRESSSTCRRGTLVLCPSVFLEIASLIQD